MTLHKKSLNTLIHSLEDSKALDIVVLDVHEKTSVTDYMIVCTGRSGRHTKAIATKLAEDMKSSGLKALSQVGLEQGEWVLLDFGDFVAHIMQPETRAFYHIEGLWQDEARAS